MIMEWMPVLSAKNHQYVNQLGTHHVVPLVVLSHLKAVGVTHFVIFSMIVVKTSRVLVHQVRINKCSSIVC